MSDNYQAIQFNTGGEPISNDGQALAKQVMTNGWGDGSAAGVRVNSGNFASARVSPDGSVVSTQGPSTASVNMGNIPNGEQGLLASLTRSGAVISASQARPDDFITLPGGITTTLANAERLGFVQHDKSADRYENVGEARLREATGLAEQERRAAAAREAEAADRARSDLNRHPVPEIEAAHAQFNEMVSEGDKIALLVQMNGKGAPNPAALERIADQMGTTAEVAADRLNNMAVGVQAQFSALARARGVDPDQAADWIRARHPEKALSALQQHVLRRDIVGAWSGLIADYKRALS
jgi:hypothetical protein